MAREAAEVDVGYRKSPIVNEHHGGRREPARFVGGPKAGDRAPDAGPLRRPDGTEARLFDLLRHGSHTLLLLAGEGDDAQARERLADIAQSAQDGLGELVRPFLIAIDEPAEDETTALLDVDGDVHYRYHAHRASLFLVRPDGYLGFVGRPPDADSLRAHLGRILE
jgi:hypothetical protein